MTTKDIVNQVADTYTINNRSTEMLEDMNVNVDEI